jgi:hypothetical protein
MTAVVSVIGKCSAPGCSRPAVAHLCVEVGGRRVAGSVCEHCRRATEAAAFLLALVA